MFEFAQVDPLQSLFNVSIEEPDEQKRDGRYAVSLSVGRPLTFNLEEVYSSTNVSLPPEVRLHLRDYQFHLVRFALNIHPSQFAMATWVEFKIDLYYRPSMQSQIVQTDRALLPIAYDMYPRNVEDKVEVESKKSISPTFKFADSVEVSGATAEFVLKYQRTKAKIAAFGLAESNPGWTLTPGADTQIPAGPKEFDLIVRRKRGSGVRCKISVEGEGRTGDWTRLFFVRPDVSGERQVLDF